MDTRQRTPLISFVFLAIGASMCHAAKPGIQSDWLQWRGPGRAGMSADTGLLDDWDKQPPRLAWMSEGMGQGFASVSIADGRIFTTGNTESNIENGQGVVAASIKDGSLLWSQPLTDGAPRHGSKGSRCTPAIDGDQLYVTLSDGTIACLAVADGAIQWKRNMKEDFGGRMMSGWGFSESPLIDGDRLICTPGGKDATIVALDKRTGDEIWRSAMPKIGDKGRDGSGYSSIVISEAAGVRQYVQMTGRGVIGVRASDGKFLWGYNDVANGTANIPTPLVSGDFVFSSTGYGAGACLLKLVATDDGVDAEEVYFLESKTLQNHHGGMLLIDGHVYCGHRHNNGFPICVELETGEVAWGGDRRGVGSGSAAITYADGNVIFRYQSGEVALIGATPEGYQLKGSFKPAHVEGPSWAHPVVVGGRLYLREQDKLMCYDLNRPS